MPLPGSLCLDLKRLANHSIHLGCDVHFDLWFLFHLRAYCHVATDSPWQHVPAEFAFHVPVESLAVPWLRTWATGRCCWQEGEGLLDTLEGPTGWRGQLVGGHQAASFDGNHGNSIPGLALPSGLATCPLTCAQVLRVTFDESKGNKGLRSSEIELASGAVLFRSREDAGDLKDSPQRATRSPTWALSIETLHQQIRDAIDRF